MILIWLFFLIPQSSIIIDAPIFILHHKNKYIFFMGFIISLHLNILYLNKQNFENTIQAIF